jgi:hypothetical protein
MSFFAGPRSLIISEIGYLPPIPVAGYADINSIASETKLTREW